MIQDEKSGVRPPVSGEGGFSLIEIIITLVVLSIAAVGVLSVFTTGIKGSADPLILNQAISLAQEKMDEAIALKKSGGFAAVGNAGAAFNAPYAAYNWVRAVECVTAADVNAPTGAPLPCVSGYAKATVTISWNVGADSVSLVTLIANY